MLTDFWLYSTSTFGKYTTGFYNQDSCVCWLIENPKGRIIKIVSNNNKVHFISQMLLQCYKQGQEGPGRRPNVYYMKGRANVIEFPGTRAGSEESIMVKVFLIDEHPVTRRGLASVLEMCSGYQVVGDANNLADALPQIEELQPDVVIMDAFGHTGDSIEAISNLHQKCPMVKVLILTDSNKEQDFVKAIRAGVRGYLLKDSDVSQLTDAIRLVAGDGAVVYSLRKRKPP